MSLREYSIGILPGVWGAETDGKIMLQQSTGRVVDELAKAFSKCYVSTSIHPNDGTRDYALQSDNVELILQPLWKKVAQGVKHPLSILKAGKRLVDSSDVIFVRGTMPYLPFIYLYAIFKAKPVVQWVAGDIVVVLKASEAQNFKGRLRTTLAWLDEKWSQIIRKSSYVYMVTSGCVLYEKYKSPRTTLVVSSTISQSEFYYRDDTCQRDPIRILYVGFVRSGKGIIYLIEALSKLRTSRQVQLAIVGDTKESSAEKARLENRINELGLTQRVSWKEYTRFGPELFSQYRRSDILVLPTLSEGAPHVLVEARAFGLPVISTNVGGIPSSIKNYEDGIMVPPADSQSLATAIDKVIDDDDFRRKLISNGYVAAKRFSLEKFIEQLVQVFEAALRERKI